MSDWRSRLRADPVPWLLDDDNPAVRHLALRGLLDRAADNPEVVEARAAAMESNPIAGILAAQDPAGWWVAPGPGYVPKYTATTWQLIFLGQMGADGADPRVRAGCEYVLEHTQTSSGAFGVGVRREGVPPPSGGLHCLNGNLLKALIEFGWLDDERVQQSVVWQTTAITGDGPMRYVGYVSGPGFCCYANEGHPCAWGATKALFALASIPIERRSPAVQRAIDSGVEFLLSRDPAVADYPTASRRTAPNSSWFKLGFPSGYVADVLQVLEALVAAGAAADPRLANAMAWLLARQDAEGRWANEYAYVGKMVANVDREGRPSKWVTLRACRVLKAIDGSGARPPSPA
ncbi:MAG: nitrogen fixation protein NifH [Candidatus Limnocylindrales bacterium]